MNDLTFSIVEIFISLVVETIMLGGLFTWISNKTQTKNEQKMQTEMLKIENQNRLIYQEMTSAIKNSRDDIISEIKEVMKE